MNSNSLKVDEANMNDILVLGAGRVGSAIVRDLAQDFAVTAADADADSLKRLESLCAAETELLDLRNESEFRTLVGRHDLIIGALPGHLGFQSLRVVLEERKPTVDISFFEEDPFRLDELARSNNVTAVVDCGVAPGLCNILLADAGRQIEVEKYRCLVGGLPVKRPWPFEYKAPFSPIDVIEEYLRPARQVVNGEIEIRPALSDVEEVDFPEVGVLEAFTTDGLRTLLKTTRTPFMQEKTLRYPGHAELMRVLREAGFFSKDPLDVGGNSIRPIDLTSRLLFPLWQLGDDEEEFTVMLVEMEGLRDGERSRLRYLLYDRFDPNTRISSMARTTGYTCCAVARLIANGRFSRKGICPPEYVGREEGCFREVIQFLESRGVSLRKDTG
ncbi:MAG TPA: saccharopine dehydrogenase C-terminal domain-containing protein [Acidobacteriota bacterium]|nr:saccharopine dehydrogenase C-terminal domain-containing protein [Acidobacteriota bacterium]